VGKLGDEIRPGRHHGPGGGLPRKIRFRGRTQRTATGRRCSRNAHRRRRRRTRTRPRWRGNTGDRARHRSRSSGRSRRRSGVLRETPGSVWRHRLAWTGENLTRAGRRWSGSRGDGNSSRASGTRGRRKHAGRSWTGRNGTGCSRGRGVRSRAVQNGAMKNWRVGRRTRTRQRRHHRRATRAQGRPDRRGASGRRSLDIFFRSDLDARRGSALCFHVRERRRRGFDHMRAFKTPRLRTGCGRLGGRVAGLTSGEMAADQQRLVVLERTRVGLLVGDAEIGEEVDDHARLYFQLPSQLIDANFAHT
jgi:hypothetical protein